MNISFREYQNGDIGLMKDLWNEILVDGVAFPGTDLYEDSDFQKMLQEQSAVTCMLLDEKVIGYYILHPNNIGRCSHVANASYVLSKECRGKHLGKYLVEKSIIQAKELDFMGMQFNAVVASNTAAIRIYRNAGFQIIGTIPKGFLLKNGIYSDMHIMYLPFTE